MPNVQILIVSAVKICEQCLKTASASGVLLDPTWEFPSGKLSGLAPKYKFPAPRHSANVRFRADTSIAQRSPMISSSESTASGATSLAMVLDSVA